MLPNSFFITTRVSIKKSQLLNMLPTTEKQQKNNLGLLDALHDANLAMRTAPQS